MSLRTATAYQPDAPSYGPAEHDVRSGVYGGLVGDMLADIDARMTTGSLSNAVAPSSEDFLHRLSVAGGYLGLIAGFAAGGAFLLNLF